MEFFLTLGVIAGITGISSAAIDFPVFRLNRRYAKLLAVAVGVILWVVLSFAGLFLLILESQRRGHPF